MNHTSEGWTEGHQQASEPDFYGKWVNVKHRLPEKDGQYWTYSPDEKYIKHHVYIYNAYHKTFNCSKPTHWMPLPEPPK